MSYEFKYSNSYEYLIITHNDKKNKIITTKEYNLKDLKELSKLLHSDNTIMSKSDKESLKRTIKEFVPYLFKGNWSEK